VGDLYLYRSNASNEAQMKYFLTRDVRYISTLHIDTSIRNTAVTSPCKHGGVLTIETVRLQTGVLHEVDSGS
jgi:hypothetical protein